MADDPKTTATEHHLKTWPQFFAAVLDGSKPFEIRPDDRGFAVGDILVLEEWSVDDGYSGRAVRKRVTYVLGHLNGAFGFGLKSGFVVMGVQNV